MTAVVSPSILTLWAVLDLIGVVLNGVIGGTIARRRGFDVVGFFFLAVFSALGGGMLRDVLIQQGAPVAITNPIYLPMAGVGALIAFLLDLHARWWTMFRVHADAIILGVWAVTGTSKALAFDLPVASAMFLGLITAVGGGMIRDVFAGNPPAVFGGQPLYAVPALVASALLVVFDSYGLSGIGMVVAGLTGALMAIFAFWMGWVLPQNSTLSARKVWMRTRTLANPRRVRGSMAARARQTWATYMKKK
ncbi:trimeric intracellular cation channel family protein [Corynebacterium sp. 11A]|uniref:trimeric intracellular cation channel family protein n=1 Tax=Corynebacterium sp. 11A TaxID=2080510 RepID=UPI00124F4E04|nr:trimeric intracellular cation channel family protein [Corynebacterium sp. 11A]